MSVQIPENAEIDYTGHSWDCRRGYARSGNGCVAVMVPANADLDYTGHSWACSQGYQRVANACRPMTPAELEQDNQRRQALAKALTNRQTGSAFETRVDSSSGQVLILENGAVLEVTRGSLGSVRSRRQVLVFRDGSRWSVWIEDKGVYACDVLREPDRRSTVSVSIAYIAKVSQSGDVVILGDNSVYEVSTIDTITTTLWLASSRVLLVGDDRMLNLDDDDQIVQVSRVR